MITREEYNNALDVIEAFNKQFFTIPSLEDLRNAGKTKFSDWEKLSDCSTRLQNLLIYIDECGKDNSNTEFVEDITKRKFMSYRNAGKGTWAEFTNLRGY